MIIQKNIDLRPFNSFRISAKARALASFTSVDELAQGIEQCKTMPLMILGGGSNVLFTRDFDGIVLKNEMKGISMQGQDENYVYLQARAGENWHQFVSYCIQKGLGGVENLSLIPGNVGASPMQNIGAYGTEIKDVFHSLEAYHLKDKKMVTFKLNDCEFGYRESIFKGKYKNQFVICSVTYRLAKKPIFNIGYGAIQQQLEAMGVTELSIANISAAVIAIRKSKLPDPAEIGNAGSFFKNPEIPDQQFAEFKSFFSEIVGYPLGNGYTKLAAGWLIEQCGWKGYRNGDAGCHSRQALVLVNYENASGSEIFELSEKIIQSVEQKFGVTLQREVNIF